MALLASAPTIAGDDKYHDHDHDPPDRPLLPREHTDGSSSTTSSRRPSSIRISSRTKSFSPSPTPPVVRTPLSESKSTTFTASPSSSQKRSCERPVSSSRRQRLPKDITTKQQQPPRKRGATSTYDSDRDGDGDEGGTGGGSVFSKGQRREWYLE